MNTYLTESFVWDHIRESRQQAAAARKASAARAVQHRPKAHARRAGLWIVRSA